MIKLTRKQLPDWAEDGSAYYYASISGWAIADTREHAKIRHDYAHGNYPALVEFYLPDHKQFVECVNFCPVDKDGKICGTKLDPGISCAACGKDATRGLIFRAKDETNDRLEVNVIWKENTITEIGDANFCNTDCLVEYLKNTGELND